MRQQPWDQLEHESAPAYAAFVLYRDMGPKRSLDAVARELEGDRGHQEGHKRAPGRLKHWSSEFEWTARARAWDQRIAKVYQGAVERAAASKAEDWVWRQSQVFETEFRVAEHLFHRAETLCKFPVSQQTVEADGKTTIIEPIGVGELRRAAAVAREASALARAAIEGALRAFSSSTPAPDPELADSRERAALELERWRAEMRARVLAIPAAPPEPMAG